MALTLHATLVFEREMSAAPKAVFAADGIKTRLKNTTQLASFIGEDMVKGYTTGANASLDSLVRYLQQ
jgi:hypothetical protein